MDKPRHLGIYNLSRKELNLNVPVPRSSQSLDETNEPIRFVELMARSNFSFLQGASHPEEMVEQAVTLDYEGIALCDLNGLYGVGRGLQTAISPSLFASSVVVKANFRYLIGTEVTLIDETALVLMPITKKGYSNLCAILTLGKRQAAKGFSKLKLEDIEKYQEELLCFAIPNISEERFLKLQNIFGDRLYIPVWRDLTWESREYFKQAIHLEKKFDAQLFVTNRPLMHSPERKPLFDVLTCILHHQKINDAKDILAQNAERHLKSLDELRHLWKDRVDLLNVTSEIAQRVDFRLDQIRYRYPNSNLPAGMNSSEYLRHLVYEGLKNRYSSQELPSKVIETAEHELKIIKNLEYEDYFLTLYEICQFAISKNILYQGRGSAANSVICYAIGLTAINPVQMGLLFERFISQKRAEPPDIDIDFEHERREEVIQHIYQKYGESHAAMVCTVIRYRSRMALRETAKVFGVPLATVNAMIKYTGRDGIRRLIDDPEAREKFQVDETTWKLMIRLTTELKGFPRHLGIHTGGFLITQDPINEMVPVEKATMEGRYVIQWNKDDVNFLKLMKIDVLSLGMLTALRKSFDLFREHKKIEYNLATLPQEDKAVYEMACKAETVGVFQIESRAQMQTLPKLKPKCFYDFVVQVAIVRPGPLQGGMVHPYLKRRQNMEKVTYAHPDLKPILAKTMGVPIFQEQVMKIVVAVAGFSPDEADELRRIMSNAWRGKGTMDGVRHRVMEGMKKHGISEQFAEQTYRTIEGFANYGFPESHAASFALLTYASSYIKRHHPDIFACSLLNSQPMGFYPSRVLISDAQKNKVQFRVLDIQRSEFDFTLEENTESEHQHDVRVGLRSVYGIPEKFLRKIVEERKSRGAFQDLNDFVRRISLPKVILMKLAAAGAFGSFDSDTRALLWKIEALSLDPQSFLWGQAKEQFALEDGEESDEVHIPFESNWNVMEREYQAKGFSVEHHPMRILRPIINQQNDKYRKQKFVPFYHSEEIQNLRHKQKVRLIGLLSVTQRPPTAKGMCFLTMEDEWGFMNIVVPPDIYERDRMSLYSSSFLHICGQIERSGSLINIRAESIKPFIELQRSYQAVNTGVSRF